MTHQFLTPEELLTLVGERLKALRLRARLTQEEVAARAQVSLRALSALENGHGSSLETFLRVLKGLKGIDRLDGLVPEVPVSPLAIRRLHDRLPCRVRHSKKPPKAGG